MATPFFAKLRRRFPAAFIACLCRRSVSDIYLGNETIDRLILLPEKGLLGQGIFKAARQIRKNNFDLAISLPNSFSAALIFFWARIPVRLGYATDHRLWLLTKALPYLPDGKIVHQSVIYTNLLSVFGKSDQITDAPVLPVDHQTKQAIELLLQVHNLANADNLAIVVPGSRAPARRWMPERYAELGDRLVTEYDHRVIFVGDVSDRPTVKTIRELMRCHAFDFSGKTSLKGLAELCARARVFLGNDSGAAHIAAAVGTPVLVLTGPGDPAQIAPLTAQKHIFFKRIPCSPCRKNICVRKDNLQECLKLISVDEVCSVLQQLLIRQPQSV